MFDINVDKMIQLEVNGIFRGVIVWFGFQSKKN
jgi:hypothetical protein